MSAVAIIGAGIAGLACAETLSATGVRVTLFDKSRGAGGRLSSRRVLTSSGEIAFDIGATHFTARSEAFRKRMQSWQIAGIVAPWPIAGNNSWIGTPTMNAPVKAMAMPHDVRWQTCIVGTVRTGLRWHLYSENMEFGPFDAVIVATPAEQAAPLLSLHDFGMARKAMEAQSRPVWTGMFAFSSPVEALADFVRCSAPLVLAVKGNARPDRSQIEHWTIQADWHWSEARLEADREAIAQELLAEFAALTGGPLPGLLFADAHRWLFAQPEGRNEEYLWNSDIALGACGDWLNHGFVELAWQSGDELGRAIGAHLARPDRYRTEDFA